MKQQVKRLFDWVEGLVDPFAPQDGVADKRPLRFLFQAMRPFRTVMILASVLGIAVAVLELGLIWYAGRLVDLMAAGSATFWADNGGEILIAAALLLLIRPLVVGLNAVVLFAGISTNVQAQTIWRGHRHLLGQPVGFSRTTLPDGSRTGCATPAARPRIQPFSCSRPSGRPPPLPSPRWCCFWG